MKRPDQRGAFGRWLVTVRKERGLSPTEVRDRLREQRGYAMAHSTYAMLESGSRRPTDEQRAHLVGFFGSEPETESTAPSSDSAAILAALERQTDLLAKLWPAVTELVEELRANRLESQERAEAVALLLGEQTRAIRDLALPSSTPDAREQRPNRARTIG